MIVNGRAGPGRENKAHQRQIALSGSIDEIVAHSLTHTTRGIGLSEAVREPALVAEQSGKRRTQELDGLSTVRLLGNGAQYLCDEGIEDG
jgi:hypothetical protein